MANKTIKVDWVKHYSTKDPIWKEVEEDLYGFMDELGGSNWTWMSSPYEANCVNVFDDGIGTIGKIYIDGLSKPTSKITKTIPITFEENIDAKHPFYKEAGGNVDEIIAQISSDIAGGTDNLSWMGLKGKKDCYIAFNDGTGEVGLINIKQKKQVKTR